VRAIIAFQQLCNLLMRRSWTCKFTRCVMDGRPSHRARLPQGAVAVAPTPRYTIWRQRHDCNVMLLCMQQCPNQDLSNASRRIESPYDTHRISNCYLSNTKTVL